METKSDKYKEMRCQIWLNLSANFLHDLGFSKIFFVYLFISYIYFDICAYLSKLFCLSLIPFFHSLFLIKFDISMYY